MQFYQFLQEWVLNNISRKELLIKLQLSHPSFSGLDNVTLSRWVTGTTSPSLSKQLLIAYYSDLLENFLELIDPAPISKIKYNNYHSFLKRFSNSYYNFLLEENKNEYLSYDKGTANALSKQHMWFKSKFKVYNDLIERSNTKFEMLYITNDGDKGMKSFVQYTKDLSGFFESLKIEFNGPFPSVETGFVVSFTHYESSEHYELLTGIFLAENFEHLIKSDEVFFIARGQEGLDLTSSFGGRDVLPLETSKKNENVYLCSIPVMKIFDNGIYFNLLKEYYPSYLGKYKKLI
ncbi:hypothetical protein [Vibrio owensii]|uniref:hypothetical protein n=1 Tax=Vibrio owensii TaxID=696485 RepID=UPI00406780DA